VRLDEAGASPGLARASGVDERADLVIRGDGGATGAARGAGATSGSRAATDRPRAGTATRTAGHDPAERTAYRQAGATGGRQAGAA
jgi:hypothetical protein